MLVGSLWLPDEIPGRRERFEPKLRRRGSWRFAIPGEQEENCPDPEVGPGGLNAGPVRPMEPTEGAHGPEPGFVGHLGGRQLIENPFGADTVARGRRAARTRGKLGDRGAKMPWRATRDYRDAIDDRTAGAGVQGAIERDITAIVTPTTPLLDRPDRALDIRVIELRIRAAREIERPKDRLGILGDIVAVDRGDEVECTIVLDEREVAGRNGHRGTDNHAGCRVDR